MHQVERRTKDLDRDEGEDLALHQEDGLHHNAEHSVSNHHRNRQVDERAALGGPGEKILYLHPCRAHLKARSAMSWNHMALTTLDRRKKGRTHRVEKATERMGSVYDQRASALELL